MSNYYVYIVRCVDNTLYTGYTTDINKRLKAHFKGLSVAAKYTKSHKPKAVEAVWSTSTKSAAMKLEYRIKQLQKSEKEYYIHNKNSISNIFESTQDEYIPIDITQGDGKFEGNYIHNTNK